MKLVFIEVSNGFNWGKFAIGRFDADDVEARSHVDQQRIIRGRGWGPDHLWVVDLQTGEGALFRHGGHARSDLDKHRIWVCPMFEPFLVWLYLQDVSDLDALPPLVELTEAEAPSAMAGYRRLGPGGDSG